ncbi:MAG: TerB family tellurite resistance protein [Bacteroidetes bacterium]|nr:TerB family tellurite resistance protein [Bacteroidota bacterium]
MKRLIVILIMCGMSFQLKAQSDEVQQLLLNIEKLAQFKKILQNMYDGYKLVSKGYTAIKNISEGNFTLHKTFLDALMEVSPGVKKYKRIADIISYQLRITKEYKLAFNRFKEDKQFSIEEIDYLGKVYSNLFTESLKSIDELAMVITSGKLRMSDDERLQAIDRIYMSVEDQYTFLKEFTNNTNLLSLQRKAEKAEIEMSRRLYGFTK